jgi:hypothetical protein
MPELLERHPDRTIFTSLPRAGMVRAATLLVHLDVLAHGSVMTTGVSTASVLICSPQT